MKILLNCLKSYKLFLTRKALETMYRSFILPIFDYADVIWDCCTQGQAIFLENLHLEGLRIVTGLVKGTSHNAIYSESGFCSLWDRREKHKLLMYFKIVNGYSPAYLANSLPPLITDVNPYHRRRPHDRLAPQYDSAVYNNSFFPSTTRIWNTLPQHIQETTSISLFKKYLNRNDAAVPVYYYYGMRKYQAIHCRLRHNMSNLNQDLFSRHLTESPACACGNSRESAQHYLLTCSLYTDARATTILTLEPNTRSPHTLLFGNENLTLETNYKIFGLVHAFIQASKRFD